MEIKKAMTEDFEKIATIEFNSGYFWSRYSYEEELDLAQKMLSEENITTFIVYVDKNPVGYIYIQFEEGVGDIGMSVIKEMQGRGVGTFMMKNIIKYCEEINLKKLKLSVWAKNKATIFLYKKFNFQIMRENKNFYKNGDSLIHMELAL